MSFGLGRPSDNVYDDDESQLDAIDYPELGFELDWVGYFKKFIEVHGDPVRYLGRLLFPDGWMYSASDYQGPEWPPPLDPAQLRELQKNYWKIRLAMVIVEHNKLVLKSKGLKEFQLAKSVPLQQTVTEESNGEFVRKQTEINVGMFDLRIEWLKLDIENCKEQLAALT